MSIRPDEIMIVNGRWTQVGFSIRSGKESPRHAVFECVCGNRKVIPVFQVKSGRSLSCGCYCSDVKKKRLTTHGRSSDSSYRCWKSMVSRCCNEKSQAFINYGGRGISVCERWRLSFERFLEDMGDKPDGTSIDRIDNSLGYFKENCRWATRIEQNRNRRSNRLLTINGQTKCVAEWAEEAGLNRITVHARLSHGWSEEAAVFSAVRSRSKSSR